MEEREQGAREDIGYDTEVQETDYPLRDEIRSLCKRIDTGYLSLAGKLRVVQNTSCYAVWGFQSFKEYLEVDLNFKERKAQYLMAIHLKFIDGLGLAEEALAEVGWSKAKELLPLFEENIITADNVQGWLEKARLLTQRELNEKVKDVTGKVTDGDVSAKLIFQVFPGQKDVIEEALKLAELISGTKHKGTSLELICGDFLATAHVAEDSLMPEDWKLSRLEWIRKVVEHVYGKTVTFS